MPYKDKQKGIEHSKQYYQKNKDRIISNVKNYTSKNIEAKKKYWHNHYIKNRILKIKPGEKQVAWNKGIEYFAIKGDKNSNWKGGITSESMKIRNSLEAKLWRDAVFARDGYICQKTGIKGGKLVVHHILNFSSNPELRFAIDNGITLSLKSHIEFHKKYGNKNNTREQLNEFLNI